MRYSDCFQDSLACHHKLPFTNGICGFIFVSVFWMLFPFLFKPFIIIPPLGHSPNNCQEDSSRGKKTWDVIVILG